MKLRERLLGALSFRERPLKTVWQVERDGLIHHLVGTAHHFPYRFKRSIETLLGRGKRVYFEGPLDPDSMNRVVALGSRRAGSASLYDALDEAMIRKIREKTGRRFREVERPEFMPIDLSESREDDPLYQHFRSLRPWMAFFSLWNDYLWERGWRYSVDMDAWEMAGRMGKEIRYLETIEEQVAAMEKIPVERIVDFLRQVSSWNEYAKAHRDAYLSGRIEHILSQGRLFPSRCPAIGQDRDPVMFERLLPSLSEEATIAFVGTVHVVGLSKRLEALGYRIEQVGEAEG
jgi:hypothetical protein